MAEYMAANAAAKHVGISDPRSIEKRIEPDAWHINAGGKRVPLFAIETLDEHAETIREAVRPGYHERVEFKLVGRRPNGKPILQVVPDSVVDEPVTPVGDDEILHRLLSKYADEDGRVADDVPGLVAEAMGAEVAQSAAMALLNSGRLTVDMTGVWTVTR